MAEKSILVVDDDADLRTLVSDFLAGNGYEVRQASGAEQMREIAALARPDLIILDLMMPGEDGLTALRKMNDAGWPPVIMLSAMGSDVDRIVGLELGADDYLAKPCNPRELLARVRAVLRRVEAETAAVHGSEVLLFADWRLDRAALELTAPDGTLVPMTRKEWLLLDALLAAGRRVLTRDELMTRIGGEEEETFDRAIDIAISRLRRKLGGHDPREIIRTVRGEGYGIAPQVTRG